MGFIRRIIFRLYNRLSLALARATGRQSAGVYLGGQYLRVPGDIEGRLRRFIIRDVYEQDERFILKKLIADEDSILEIGAAIGCLASNYSKLSRRKHIAIEASPRLIGILEHNISAATRCNVRVINAFAATKSGTSSLFVGKDIYSSTTVENNGERLEVESVNVSTLICDIEGFEYELFNKIDLSNIQKMLIEFHNVGDTASAVVDLLERFWDAGFGFDVRQWRGNVLVFSR